MLTYEQQDEFRARVKGELARRRMTAKELGEEISRTKTSVYMAINRGMFEETQRRIDAYLGLGFFEAVAEAV